MKRILLLNFTGFLLLAMTPLAPLAARSADFWTRADSFYPMTKKLQLRPQSALVYKLDETKLRGVIWDASQDPGQSVSVSLPLPNGIFRDFKVWQTPMMEAKLAAKYPEIRTYSGYAIGNKAITAKLEFTAYGFSAMVYNGDETFLIDPANNDHDGFYTTHYKNQETRKEKERMQCLVENIRPGGQHESLMNGYSRTFNGHTIRTYRLALSANSFYCQAATGLSSPSISQALSKMTITMNRVNGIYNRDFSVQMNFCADEDTLIWTAATGTVNGLDPFNTINSSGSACLTQNQSTVTARIGVANYDVGHVFTTGGGGISLLGVVCNASGKAQSVTGSPMPVGDGFDVDYVAHEMGHAFGSNHTFNDNANGSCAGNAVSVCAYEPGSGATVMDYAGICTGDNLQANSDPYFGASSLMQIQNLLATSENTCAVTTSSGNKLVYLDAFSASYTIPYKTPFELIGPTAVDSVADTATTYGWAQWNRGDFGKKWVQTFVRGPIIRSYNPAYTPVRVIPKLSVVLAGGISAMGEKAPDTARFLTFKMVVRNILNGHGSFLFPDDTIHIDAVSTGDVNGYAGFKVTSQNTTGIAYTGGSTQTIMWNVVGSDVAPVNTANVNIYMSVDGGVSWQYFLGTFPNNGSAAVTVPNPASTTGNARFKVKGKNNVFFNVNTKNFRVSNDPSLPVTTTAIANVEQFSNIRIYPNPVSDRLYVDAAGYGPVDIVVYDLTGRVKYSFSATGTANINVSDWAKGIYIVRIFEGTTGLREVRKVVIQ